MTGEVTHCAPDCPCRVTDTPTEGDWGSSPASPAGDSLSPAGRSLRSVLDDAWAKVPVIQLSQFTKVPPHNERLLDVMDPADREALEVGLLLAELEQRLGPDARWDLYQHFLPVPGYDPAFVGYGAQVDDFTTAFTVSDSGAQPTPHAALTALLAALPVPA